MSLLILFKQNGPAAHVLDAEVGSFSLTGQNATLQRAVSLNAASGSFTLTGQSANTAVGRAINAASTSFALTGQAATVTRTLVPLDAASTSFTITGQDATFDRTFASREINAEVGNFDILGQDASFLRSRIFNAESATEGQYQASDYVDPTYVEGIGYKVDGQSYHDGTYVQPEYVSGSGATLARSRNFSSESGIFVLTGSEATLLKTSIFPAPSDVLIGVSYGPGGIYIGTYDPYGVQYDVTTGRLVKPLTSKIVMSL